MEARDRSESAAAEQTAAAPAAANARSDLALQRVAARGAVTRGVSPATMRALQGAAGNRAVARMVTSAPRQQIQRDYANELGQLVEGGNLLGGQFRARIEGLGTRRIWVDDWVNSQGENQNNLRMGGYQKYGVWQRPDPATEPGF